jgi:hypothetical protein
MVSTTSCSLLEHFMSRQQQHAHNTCTDALHHLEDIAARWLLFGLWTLYGIIVCILSGLAASAVMTALFLRHLFFKRSGAPVKHMHETRRP